MKAMLYHKDDNKPVAVFDEIKLIEMNDNHSASPYRITYKSEGLNSGKTMVELHRDEKMTLKMDDGRSCEVLLQHNSLDMKGNATGVLRVLGEIA